MVHYSDGVIVWRCVTLRLVAYSATQFNRGNIMASFSITTTGVSAILSKAQVRALALVDSMDADTLAVVASVGKGATRTLAAAAMASAGFDKLCQGFIASECKNVSNFARAIRAITGQLADSEALPACPLNHVGFYAYRADISAWARGAYDKKEPSGKTLTARATVATRVTALIDHVESMRADYIAAQEAQALQDAGMVETMPA